MKEPKPPKAENQAELQKIFAGVVINVLAKMTGVERELFFNRLQERYCFDCGCRTDEICWCFPRG